MYDSDPVQELSDDINLIDENVLHLKELNTKLGTKDDTSRLRHELHEIRQETQGMVLDVRDRINELPLSMRAEKARLVQEFGGVLHQYQAAQSESLRKEKIVVSSLTDRMERDQEKARGRADDDSFTLEELGVKDVDLHILVEQNAEIKSIEKDMTQINELFKDMGQIVEAAKPQLEAVEEKVGTTKIATEEASTSLAQAMRSAILARWKTLLIASIILLVVVLIVVIVASIIASKT